MRNAAEKHTGAPAWPLYLNGGNTSYRLRQMDARDRLAAIAERSARRPFHGNVMSLEPNLQPIVDLFPPWPLRKWNDKWCAAFVYYCCRQAGLQLPFKYPDESVKTNFASCDAWLSWAKLPETGFYSSRGNRAFCPARGDIVVYDNVFDPSPHDHMGIVLRNHTAWLTVAEGNVNNVSAVLNRPKNSHIRGYIRIPDRYWDVELVRTQVGEKPTQVPKQN